jgi:hypothetical protein
MAMAASAGTSASQQITATILIYLIIATVLGIAYEKWFHARAES